MRAVIDTNVLISAFITPDGAPARILRSMDSFTLVSCEVLLVEIERVIHYDHIQRKFNLSDDHIAAYMNRLRAYSEIFDTPPAVKSISRDPDDDKFLACAIAGAADYVVSGDRHLLELGVYEEIRIVTPAEFLVLLQPSPKDD
jgi:putative PIN family toxin of toxin-antitoxin system